MHERLFSYGTLQLESVQLETFKRKLKGKPDVLLGYEIRDCIIDDPDVVAASGDSVHPIACHTGQAADQITGMVFEVTQAEMAEADQYEVAAYQKVEAVLQSGFEAWVYVKAE